MQSFRSLLKLADGLVKLDSATTKHSKTLQEVVKLVEKRNQHETSTVSACIWCLRKAASCSAILKRFAYTKDQFAVSDDELRDLFAYHE